MWFRLKEKYSLESREGHVISDIYMRDDKWVVALKRGAPIKVRVEDVVPFFKFGHKEIIGLTFKDCEVPPQCAIDKEGSVFCATNREFVCIKYPGFLNPRINFCPGCGKKLVDWPPFPEDEKLEMYEIKTIEKPWR